MIKQLQTYIKNKQSVTREEGEHLQILGSNAKVQQCARIWEQQGDMLELIAAVKLHNWTSDYQFTQEELQAFKEGLAVIPVFLVECWNEVEKSKQKDLKKEEK